MYRYAVLIRYWAVLQQQAAVHINQLPAEPLGTFPCKHKIFRNRVRKAIINGVK